MKVRGFGNHNQTRTPSFNTEGNGRVGNTPGTPGGGSPVGGSPNAGLDHVVSGIASNGRGLAPRPSQGPLTQVSTTPATGIIPAQQQQPFANWNRASFPSRPQPTSTPQQLRPTAPNPSMTAQQLLANAQSAEPKITSDITRLSDETGGKLEGLEYRLKSQESLARKLNQVPPDQIKDALRYTIVYHGNNLAANTNHVINSLEQSGYQKIKVKNTFGPNSQYQGINTSFKSPQGQVFEQQMHTPESFHVKQNLTHQLYEELRVLPPNDPRVAEIQQKITELSNQIPLPPNIGDVKNFP